MPRDKLSFELLTLPLPFVLWYFVFRSPPFGFWPTITLSAMLLFAVSLYRIRRMPFRVTFEGFVVGLASALALYSFFWAGFQIVKGAPGLSQQVSMVYGLRGGFPLELIALALVFPIGPTEEVYWHGLIQRYLNVPLGTARGLLTTTILYSAIHIPTLNPSLLLVALVGGLVWGYLFNRYDNLFPVIVSHILFDELIFVILIIS